MKLFAAVLFFCTQAHASPELEALRHRFEAANNNAGLSLPVIAPKSGLMPAHAPTAKAPSMVKPPAKPAETYSHCGFALGFMRVITLGGGKLFPASWAFFWIPLIPLTLIPAVIAGIDTASRGECGTTQW